MSDSNSVFKFQNTFQTAYLNDYVSVIGRMREIVRNHPMPVKLCPTVK